MRSIREVIKVTSATVAVIALAACGGGGGGGGSDTGNTGVSTISQGVITAKGSIFVNGIEFDTTGASIKIDDNPNGTDAGLKEGMIVKVRGSSDDATRKGKALEIEARNTLEGEIEAVDGIGNTITVGGQLIRLEDNVTRLNDDNTAKVFDDGNFQVGNRVEVNAFPDDNGGLRATRVAKVDGTGFEIKGFVTAITGNSFGLSLLPGGAATLTVNATALPAGLTAGAFVEVKAAGAPAAGVLTATLVKLEDRVGAGGAQVAKVEVEGLITNLTITGGLASFVINGQPVVTTANTLFEGGTFDDLAADIKVEAEGPVNANGEIVATKISFRSNIRIEGIATAATVNDITVLGIQVALNPAPLTRYDGTPGTNDYVEVRAFRDRFGNLVATRVIEKSPSTRAHLQGPVTVNATTAAMSILGIPIVTNNQTELRLSTDSGDLPVTSVAFFGQLVNNVTVVKVRWDPFTSTAEAVKQAEIQLGD